MLDRDFIELYYPRIVLFILQALLPVFILFSLNYNPLYWVPCVLIYLFLFVIGFQESQHAYFAHSQFNAPKWFEKFLSFIPLYYWQSPYKFSLMHQIHHDYSDTENDPAGAINPWYKRIFLGLNKIPDKKIIEEYGNKLRNKKLYLKLKWIEHNFMWIIFCPPLFLLCFGFDIFLFFWAIPSSLTLWVQASTNFAHRNDSPKNTNNILLHLLWVREGSYHKDHHDNPRLHFGVLNNVFSKRNISCQ